MSLFRLTNKTLFLIFISVYVNFAWSDDDLVPPKWETTTQTYSYKWPGKVYFADLNAGVLYWCDLFRKGTSSSLDFYCPSSGINLVDSREGYRKYQINYESWKGSRQIGGAYAYIIEEDSQIQVCPVSHPNPIDLSGNGEIDYCSREACESPSGKSVLDSIEGLLPSSFNFAGNPVKCSTGEKYQVENIYSGSERDALNVNTYYASPKYEGDPQSLGLLFNSHQGQQRNDNFQRKIKLLAAHPSGGKIYRITYKNGFSHIFYGSNGAYQSNYSGSGSFLGLANGGFTHTTPSGDKYDYNSEGLLTQRTLANGLTRTFTYTTSGKLSTVTNHYSERLQYFYNTEDLQEKMLDPENKEYWFEYDSNQNMTKIIFPDDTVSDLSDNPYIQFLFENPDFPNNMTGKINEKGVRLATWHYDDKGRAISSEHAQEMEKVELDYSVENQTKVTHHVSDTLANQAIYHYSIKNIKHGKRKLLDKYERLACNDCQVGNWEYQYDSNGYVSQSTSPGGVVTSFSRNGAGLETSRIEAVGTPEEKQTLTTWNYDTRLPLVVNSGQLKKEFNYNNTTNQLTSVVATDLTTNVSRSVTYDFMSAGLLNAVDGSRTDVNDSTSFTYNVDGNIETTTNAKAHVVTFADYDASGRVGKITDANGVITTLTYTSRGWLKTSTTNNAQSTYDYYATGAVKSITNPAGMTLNYEYDDGERLTAIVDSLGNRIDYTLDLMGNTTETNIKDPNGVIHSTKQSVFNALGQLKKSLGNNGQVEEVQFDKEGNFVNNKNALNHSTTSSYDALNRLQKSIDPDNAETTYEYNSQDLLTKVTDAENKSTQYEYNAFGEITKLTSPDTGVTTFTYDSAGNMLTKTDARGVTVTLTYDALNRVKTQSYSDSIENIVYSYDDTTNGNKGIGRLTSVTDQSGSTSYVYNAFGQVTQETRVIEGNTYVTQYHFDANGQMTGITYPGGRKLVYSFDALGRVSGLSSETLVNNAVVNKTLASNITYQPFGPMNSLTYGNNKTLTQTYDLDYRLTDKTITGVNDVNYVYDLTNNIAAINNVTTPTESQSFTYDKLSRLLDATGIYGDLGYTYDKVGNRLSKTQNTAVDNYQYDTNSHQLLSVTGVNPLVFTHDAMGNTLTKDGLTFTYNQQARMATAAKTGMTASYRYNFKGERSSKLVNGVKIQFIYDLNGQLIAEADATGVIQNEYIYVNGQRLASINNGALYYVHSDHLDTPIALTDEAGVVQWKAHYTPFGEAIVDVNNIQHNIRFPGQYYDEESGLHYNYFRDYDPEIGRYIQSDPIGLNGGINTYGYVGGNPVNRIDPNGLLEIDPRYIRPQSIAIGIATADGPEPGPADVLALAFSAGMLLHQMTATFPASTESLEEALARIKKGTIEQCRFEDEMPEDNAKCKVAKSHVRKLLKEIYGKRIPELWNNPGSLPERLSPNESLRESVRGHRTLLNEKWNRLLHWERQMRLHCK